MKKRYRIAIILLLFFMLILVRAFATRLFYDPFIQYFKNDYLYKAMPVFVMSKLFLNILLRYLLNFAFSLIILYVAFQKRAVIQFSIKFYAITFVIFMLAFYLLLQTDFQKGYLLAFYIRRFLIHPLFVLVLLPAFYYQEKEHM
ncbi:MAG: exosortase F system-associated protein [Flavobacteriaceae bacterium]|nr:exosortase F system-associated protein [Flavobacteriaceae bacterium]